MSGYVCTANSDRLGMIALENNLYSPDGGLRDYFERAIEKPEDSSITMYYVDDVPVGACHCDRTDGKLAVWVMPDHRGKGYGQQLIMMMIAVTGLTRNFLHAELGNDAKASLRFWHKNRIFVLPDVLAGQVKFMQTMGEAGVPVRISAVKQFIADKSVEQLRELKIDHHHYVDDYLTRSKMSVENYTVNPNFRLLTKEG